MRAMIFDLDGTLIDTVYAHIFAWQKAFADAGLAIDGWRIHRRIGMSGGLFTRAAGRELGRELTPEEVRFVHARHSELFLQLLPERRPLPGAVELIGFLRANPAAAEAYARVKTALAKYHAAEVEAYYDVKDPVCDIIMSGAELWAAASRWQPGPSDC